ncbi:MbnP family protein [Fluviicola sp.]|uniref:MbnP family protein n=1 Tax=Fluviicola sp. TaxID=1917219 RepID=UPI00261B976F|nr:MbnP family protein [Fluviicola sp.]
MKHFSILALLIVIAFSSCKKKKEEKPEDSPVVQQSRLSLKPMFDLELLYLDSVYTMSNGYKIRFLELKAYFTNIESGGSVLKDAALFDFRTSGNRVFQADQVVANPSSIQFGIGVPASVNHNDPSTFPNNNPLNIAIANDMHWDWNPGYIFFKVEAKVDTIVDGITNCDHSLVYHVGTDSFYTTKSVSNLHWTQIASGLNEAWLKLDLKNFFENNGNEINVKTEFTTHSMASQSVLTEKARQNFAASISAL